MSSSQTINHVDVDSIKTHGVLMTLGWLLLGATGLLFPRYLRSATPGKFGWLIAHVVLVALTLILVVAGLGVIIDYAGNWPYTKAQISSNPHPAIGVISCILLFANFPVALARSLVSEESKARWVLNWIHRLAGNLAFVFGFSAIILAGWMPKVTASGNGNDGINIYGFVSVLIVYGVSYYVVHLILTEIDKIASERETGEFEPSEKVNNKRDNKMKIITTMALVLIAIILVSLLEWLINEYVIIPAE